MKFKDCVNPYFTISNRLDDKQVKRVGQYDYLFEQAKIANKSPDWIGLKKVSIIFYFLDSFSSILL